MKHEIEKIHLLFVLRLGAGIVIEIGHLIQERKEFYFREWRESHIYIG